MLVLGYAGTKSFKKGLKLWRKESENRIKHPTHDAVLDGEANNVSFKYSANRRVSEYINPVDNSRVSECNYALLTNDTYEENEVNPMNSVVNNNTRTANNNTDIITKRQTEKLLNEVSEMSTSSGNLESRSSYHNDERDDMIMKSLLTDNHYDNSFFRHNNDNIDKVNLPELIIPTLTLLLIFMVWIYYAAAFITMHEAVDNCSTGYFLIFGATYPPLFIYIYWATNYVKSKQVNKVTKILDGDLDFTKLSYLPAILALVIGVLCSLLGKDLFLINACISH